MGHQHSNDALRCVAEDLWLNYLNRYLLCHQVITEREYRQMVELITQRTARQRSRNETR